MKLTSDTVRDWTFWALSAAWIAGEVMFVVIVVALLWLYFVLRSLECALRLGNWNETTHKEETHMKKIWNTIQITIRFNILNFIVCFRHMSLVFNHHLKPPRTHTLYILYEKCVCTFLIYHPKECVSIQSYKRIWQPKSK